MSEGRSAEVEEADAHRMTLLEHLWELRDRLIRSGVALLAAFGVTAFFGAEIFAWLTAPALPFLPEGSSFIFTRPAEKFITDLKVSLFAAIFLALPVLFYQAWKFVAPGLYRSERRMALPFVVFSTGFFLGGAAFCYFTVLPWGMRFFLGFGSADVLPMFAVSDYLTFVTRMLLAFGFVFELPLAIFFLARLGIVSAEGLAAFRKYAIVLIFVAAAILTPPDVVTQMALGLPLVLLYEVGIVTARLWGKPRPAEAPE